MANEEHLRILSEGAEAWNRWREEHPDVRLDLSGADLSGVRLRGVILDGVDFEGACLSKAEIRFSSFAVARLVGANLDGANLVGADLGGADLRRAILRGAYLDSVDLSDADLGEADLRGAGLLGARLHHTDLKRAHLGGAWVGGTTLSDVDLSDVKGLEAVMHQSPSTIGINTVYRSGGRIPEVFLRGCGVPDEFIAYMGSLVGRTIEYHSCFISHSSTDQAFAERLHADLQTKGVRCWFAPEDLKIGDRFRQRIDEAIRLHDKLLLILSEHSVKSDWVASEVEAAFEKERRHAGQSILFPIRLDDAVMEADQAWAADIRRTRHIGDFTRWKEHDAYREGFERLVRDLKAG